MILRGRSENQNCLKPATNNDETNRIEVKPTYTYCKKQLMVAVASFTSLRKFTTDVLGNLYEVKQNVLKMEFE